MREILTAAQMKAADENTIKKHGMSAMVLMETAARACVKHIGAGSVAVVCGTGNNGADGVAVARLLKLRGQQVTVFVCGDENRYTQELRQQIEIAKSYGVEFVDELRKLPEKTDTVVDAIFGIGLSRQVSGSQADAIDWINEREGALVISVDMPSGFSADTGALLGYGVKAAKTVTFSYLKAGQLLGQCKTCGTGELILEEVGIFAEGMSRESLRCFEAGDLPQLLPKRPKDANKGSCGKLLVLAGSKDIYGACYLCAKAAMVTGAGLVKVYTHNNNTTVLKDRLPEAITVGYDSFDDEEEPKLKEMLKWADTVLAGPGISCSDEAAAQVKLILENFEGTVIADADALNICAKNSDWIKKSRAKLIITPHMLEMSRLSGLTVDELKADMLTAAKDFSKANGCITVLKNHCTVITTPAGDDFINVTGNEGMATAGSGDVLAGIIAGLAGQGLLPEIGAPLGAYIHGEAGFTAAMKTGVRGMLASDIIDGISEVLK
ncbi:MAG: NAD(P)H-hydrate dehydratase [Pseudobutyrivibrio sp.]|nr:NAD(P)H-hydrate dehydratase [Pseudobutyrivibrio sp.]